MVDQTRAPLKRVSSGIAALDAILQGGFLEGGIYMIVGSPGAGKTILGNQFCFNYAREGGRALYMTLLAETHARMLAHISPLAFYDPSVVGNNLTYISGYATLERDGLDGLVKLIVRLARETRCTLLVVDGLATAEASAPTELEYRRFLHELQVLMETVGCTAFLLTQPGEHKMLSEHTMVDGLLKLTETFIGPHPRRELEVDKFRGSNYMRGLHPYEITGEGVRIFPLTEVVLSSKSRDGVINGRKRFGVKRLDEMLSGGLPSGSSTMILGAPGTGKTIMGLHFLYQGLLEGERAAYLGFYESPNLLIDKAASLGLDLIPYLRDGTLTCTWLPWLGLIPDAVAEDLLNDIHRRGVKRLFIDSIEPFQDAMIHSHRTPLYFTALVHELRALGVTSCFVNDLPDLFSDRITVPVAHMAALVDNVIFLRCVELRSQLYRLISIMKMRASHYDTSIREFRIDARGISVASTFKSAEAILTGVARPIPRAIIAAIEDPRAKPPAPAPGGPAGASSAGALDVNDRSTTRAETELPPERRMVWDQETS